MIQSNLKPLDQLDFKRQATYRVPKFQGSTIERHVLNFADLGAEYSAEDLPLIVAPVQGSGKIPEFGILAPYQPISIESIDEDIYSRLNEIVLDRKRLLLKKPIGISSDFRDGVWIMENKDFGILCMSTDYKECLGDFYEEVFFIWEQYGQEDDDKLTNDAKELKRKILEHVGE